MVAAHRGLAKDVSIQPPYRTRYPPTEVVDRKGGRGHLRALQIDPQLHLREPQPPLYQREHPPAMDSGDDPRSGKALMS
jgi:hypothetical protein